MTSYYHHIVLSSLSSYRHIVIIILYCHHYDDIIIPQSDLHPERKNEREVPSISLLSTPPNSNSHFDQFFLEKYSAFKGKPNNKKSAVQLGFASLGANSKAFTRMVWGWFSKKKYHYSGIFLVNIHIYTIKLIILIIVAVKIIVRFCSISAK